eukprot:g28248.t1
MITFWHRSSMKSIPGRHVNSKCAKRGVLSSFVRRKFSSFLASASVKKEVPVPRESEALPNTDGSQLPLPPCQAAVKKEEPVLKDIEKLTKIEDTSHNADVHDESGVVRVHTQADGNSEQGVVRVCNQADGNSEQGVVRVYNQPQPTIERASSVNRSRGSRPKMTLNLDMEPNIIRNILSMLPVRDHFILLRVCRKAGEVLDAPSAWPTTLFVCEKLGYVRLAPERIFRGPQYSGRVPAHGIARLRKLLPHFTTIRGCGRRSLILFANPHTQTLDLQSHDADGWDDDQLAHLEKWTGLKELHIEGFALCTDGLRHLQNVPVRNLSIHVDAWSGRRRFSDLPTKIPLEELTLYVGDGMHMDHLTHLNSDNFPGLKRLNLSCNRMSAREMLALAGCLALEELDLSSTNVDNSGLTALQSLTELRKLDLSDCPEVTGMALQLLAQLSSLEELDLHGTNIEAADLSLLGHLPLKKLDLTSAYLFPGVNLPSPENGKLYRTKMTFDSPVSTPKSTPRTSRSVSMSASGADSPRSPSSSSSFCSSPIIPARPGVLFSRSISLPAPTNPSLSSVVPVEFEPLATRRQSVPLKTSSKPVEIGPLSPRRHSMPSKTYSKPVEIEQLATRRHSMPLNTSSKTTCATQEPTPPPLSTRPPLPAGSPPPLPKHVQTETKRFEHSLFRSESSPAAPPCYPSKQVAGSKRLSLHLPSSERPHAPLPSLPQAAVPVIRDVV